MSAKYLLFWMLSFYTDLWEMMNKAFLELDISPQNGNLNLLVQIKFLNLFLYSSK
jgi:hypothetical protein